MFVVMCKTYPEGLGFRTMKQAILFAKKYANDTPKCIVDIYQVTKSKVNVVGRIYGSPRNPNLLYVDDSSKLFGERPLKIETNGSISELWH